MYAIGNRFRTWEWLIGAPVRCGCLRLRKQWSGGARTVVLSGIMSRAFPPARISLLGLPS